MTFTDEDVAELNRLIRRGLLVQTAMAVMAGKLDEEFEVANAEIGREADRWCMGRKNVPEALVPGWDYDPRHIYLAYDGEDPDGHVASEYVRIEVDVADVHSQLHFQAGRDEGPWHEDFKSKSCETAYRWAHGLLVTPPVIEEIQGRIYIRGGMHRYHLAQHYGANRMPFYVMKSELAKVLDLLPGATLRWQG